MTRGLTPGTNAHRFAAMGVRFTATDRPEVLSSMGLVERRGPDGAWRYSRAVLRHGGGTWPLRRNRDGTLTVELWLGSLAKVDERFQAALQRVLPCPDFTLPARGGWVRWNGGPPPVEEDVEVMVRFRAGAVTMKPVIVLPQGWEHKGKGGDIVAYRVMGQGR